MVEGEVGDNGESEDGHHRDSNDDREKPPHRFGMGMALWSARGGTGGWVQSRAW